MGQFHRVWSLGFVLVAGCGSLDDRLVVLGEERSNLEPAHNSAGIAETAHASGVIDRTNPFFENLGTNGRTCETCHDSRSAWTTSADLMSELFETTSGTHPLFVSLHDSGNRPDAPTGTLDEKRAAFQTLLEFGVHRFTRNNHVGIDYDVIAVDDPWGFSTVASFSNFRRAGTNMGNVNRVASSTTTGTPNPTLRTQLEGLMNGATLFHAQTTVLVPIEKRVAGADFMLGLSFAQSVDKTAGPLDAAGARGGPVHLAAEPFPVAGRFDLYDAWVDACGDGAGASPSCSKQDAAREQLARGQELFNTLTFQVSDVAGLNDELGIPGPHHHVQRVSPRQERRFVDQRPLHGHRRRRRIQPRELLAAAHGSKPQRRAKSGRQPISVAL